MSKYIDAEKLKVEIDNLESFSCISEEQDGFYSAISRINGIIDSLQQEQPDEPVTDCHDLEEAARAYSEEVTDGHNYRDLTCGFIAGAEWQKAKILKDNPVIMSVEDFQALIDSHAKRVEADYKEKMMEGAVEGVVWWQVGKNISIRVLKEACKYLEQDDLPYNVRIIILPKED